jgi:hypothetical protein
VSTSTGCFFSYLAFAVSFVLFVLFGWIQKKTVVQLWIRLIFCGISIVLLMLALFPALIKSGFLKFFYVGFAKHGSFMTRWTHLLMYWDVFLDNFWVGTGLGSASTYLAYQHYGHVDVLDSTLLTEEEFCPSNVTTELLGSLGIVGATAFGWFLWTVVNIFRKTLSINMLSEEEKTRLISFAMSLAVLFFTLQFNQSIMRSYLWVHTGLAVGYAQWILQKYRGLPDTVHFLK